MIIAQGHEIEKQFGPNIIFSNVSFAIDSKARIGMVGPNGSGKTTLLKIMTGQEDATKGSFTINKGIDIGYTAQENNLNEQNSIWNEMLSVFQGLIKESKRLKQIQKQISAHPNDEKLLKDYDKRQFNFEQNGGYRYQTEIKRVLNGFNFNESTWKNKIADLSGGEKTRLSFVKLLLRKPALLLLDEPTNYLDLDTLDWLEGFLKNYDGAILTVSHDQYFLDHLAKQIFELNFGKLTTFKGNYSAYVQQRRERNKSQEAAYQKQQAEIKKDEQFIQKNLVRATTTKRAQSRRKKLAKLVKIKPPKHKRQLRIRFQAANPSGKEVLILNNLTIGYPKNTMVRNINFQVNKGDRVAVIGPNGVGKSTLLKTIMKQLPAKKGSIKYGASLEIGYYDQELKKLDPAKTVIDTVWDRHKSMPERNVRSILASFLFTAKDIDKTVAQLSGGQKARLTLTVLALEKDNFLLMDEPTNHLDIEAKEVLESALADYSGSLLFVSHDRYFINKLANKIVVIKNGLAQIYDGNYSYYLQQKQQQAARQKKQEARSKRPEKIVSAEKISYQKQKKRESEIRKRKRDIARAEEIIEHLEAQDKNVQEKMAAPDIVSNFDKLKPLQEELAVIKKKLQTADDEWEKAIEALDDLK